MGRTRNGGGGEREEDDMGGSREGEDSREFEKVKLTGLGNLIDEGLGNSSLDQIGLGPGFVTLYETHPRWQN